MKNLLKWCRIVGVMILVLGWIQRPNLTAAQFGWVIAIGVVVTLADLIGKVLNFEVELWTPLWEVLGMMAGGILLIIGAMSFFCYGLFTVGIPNPGIGPILISLGIVLAGAATIVGTQMAKYH